MASAVFQPFESPLVGATLVRRYKRFLADIRLDTGEEIIAHCPNSGSMLGLDAAGTACLVRHVPDPKRKLKWTWELVRAGNTWVGINTMRPNRVVEWALAEGHVDGITPGLSARREVRYGREGRSRVDLVLDHGDGLHYIEVKNTTLASHDIGKRPGTALFPDAVTARGAKHMDDLVHAVEQGHRASVVFFVNRADCHSFDVARDIDPTYARALDAAVDTGVHVVPLAAEVTPQGWRIRGQLPSPWQATPGTKPLARA